MAGINDDRGKRTGVCLRRRTEPQQRRDLHDGAGRTARLVQHGVTCLSLEAVDRCHVDLRRRHRGERPFSHAHLHPTRRIPRHSKRSRRTVAGARLSRTTHRKQRHRDDPRHTVRHWAASHNTVPQYSRTTRLPCDRACSRVPRRVEGADPTQAQERTAGRDHLHLRPQRAGEGTVRVHTPARQVRVQHQQTPPPHLPPTSPCRLAIAGGPRRHRHISLPRTALSYELAHPRQLLPDDHCRERCGTFDGDIARIHHRRVKKARCGRTDIQPTNRIVTPGALRNVRLCLDGLPGVPWALSWLGESFHYRGLRHAQARGRAEVLRYGPSWVRWSSATPWISHTLRWLPYDPLGGERRYGKGGGSEPATSRSYRARSSSC